MQSAILTGEGLHSTGQLLLDVTLVRASQKLPLRVFAQAAEDDGAPSAVEAAAAETAPMSNLVR